MKKGFTLIELLVVMGVLFVVGLIVGAILFSSLRGANKTNAITVVRQNGNYTISQMVKTIRNAKRFDGVKGFSDIDYTLDCSGEDSLTKKYQYIKITSPDEGLTVFACNSPTISSNSASLVDTSAVAVVENTCSFTCTQRSISDSPTIGISFSLKYNQPGSGIFAEKTANVLFQTSVTLRNEPR